MALSVSSIGYYAWRQRNTSRRAEANRLLQRRIETIHAETWGLYGSPKIHEKLQQEGLACSRKRVIRLMRQANLRAKRQQCFKRATRRNPAYPTAPNRLQQNLVATQPVPIRLADITYVRTAQGWLYLAVLSTTRYLPIKRASIMNTYKRFAVSVSFLLMTFLAACTVPAEVPLEIKDKTKISASPGSVSTPTPTPMGTWDTVIRGTIHDAQTETAKPIGGASIRYDVLHSHFAELQIDRPNTTITDELGMFALPVLVHDTDTIRILVEAQGYISYEVKLVGVDLLVGGNFDISLTPSLTTTRNAP